MAQLSSLPPELLTEVLHYLPLRALLSFGATSSDNHAFALSCLNDLDIGIHPSRRAANLRQNYTRRESLDAGDESSRTNIILGESQCSNLYLTIYHQNELATKIVNSYAPTIRSLDLSIWDLRQETATALSRISKLRHLTLRMDHPHARVSNMSGQFWYSSPGSPVWNKLYSSPKKAAKNMFPLTPPATPPLSPQSSRSPSPEPWIPSMVFGELRTLHLERAGITDYQIIKIIRENPYLREIRLKKCLTLTDEFFRDLAHSEICSPYNRRSKQGLKVLHFEMSDTPEIDARILQYITLIAGAGLESLSLAGCTNLQNQTIQEMNEAEWCIPNLKLPHAEGPLEAKDVEIDPLYID